MEEEFDEASQKELDETLRRAVENVLKNLLKSVKLSRLYPADNPLPLQAINQSFFLLDEFLTVEGELPLVPTRDGFVYQGKVIALESQDLKELAIEFRAKSILRFTFYAGLTLQELSDFINLLNLDIDSIRIQGGYDSLLWVRGIGSITVKEGTIKMVEAAGTLEEGLSSSEIAFYKGLLEKGELSLGEQKILFRFLNDPEKLAEFLKGLGKKEAELKEQDKEDYMTRLLEALKKISEIISGEQGEHQSLYFRSVGEAILALDDEIKARLIGESIVEEKIKPVIRSLEELGPSELSQGFKNVVKEEKDLEDLIRILDQSNLSQAFKEEILKAFASLAGEKKELERAEDIQIDLGLIKEHQEAVKSIANFDTSFSEQERKILQNLNSKLSTDSISMRVAQILIEMIYLTSGNFEIFTQVIERIKEMVGLLVKMGDFVTAREIVRALREKQTIKGSIEEYRLVDKAIKHFSSVYSVVQTVETIKDFERESRDFKEAVSFLALLDRESTINCLLDLLGKEKQISRRKMMCNILAHLGTYEVQVLGSRIEDPRWFLVRNIVNTLSLIGGERVYPYLIKACSYPDVRVRKSAVKALARLKLPQATSFLLQLLENEKEPEVLETIIAALSALRAKEARQPLIDLINKGSLVGDDFELKLAAIGALGNIGSTETLSFLEELSKTRSLVWSGKAREIREKAIEAIKAIKEDKNVELLEGGSPDGQSEQRE